MVVRRGMRGALLMLVFAIGMAPSGPAVLVAQWVDSGIRGPASWPLLGGAAALAALSFAAWWRMDKALRWWALGLGIAEVALGFAAVVWMLSTVDFC